MSGDGRGYQYQNNTDILACSLHYKAIIIGELTRSSIFALRHYPLFKGRSIFCGGGQIGVILPPWILAEAFVQLESCRTASLGIGRAEHVWLGGVGGSRIHDGEWRAVSGDSVVKREVYSLSGNSCSLFRLDQSYGDSGLCDRCK